MGFRELGSPNQEGCLLTLLKDCEHLQLCTRISSFFCVGIMTLVNSEKVNEKDIKSNSYKWEIAGGWALPMSTCASLQEAFKQAGTAQIEDEKSLTVRNITMLRCSGLKGAVQRKLEQTR